MADDEVAEGAVDVDVLGPGAVDHGVVPREAVAVAEAGADDVGVGPDDWNVGAPVYEVD